MYEKCQHVVCGYGPSVADVHLTFLIVISREGRESDWLTLKSTQVDQACCLSAAKVWNINQKNFLAIRACGKKQEEN